MKMQQVSLIFSLLSLPSSWLVVCDGNSNHKLNAMAIMSSDEALVATRTLRSSSYTTDFNDGGDSGRHDHHPVPLFQTHHRALRDLQFISDACNVSYTELWEDQALNDAANTYSANYDEAMSSISTCVDGSSQSIRCTLEGPIDGEAEYESACIAAGGEIIPFAFNLDCDGTLQGSPSSILVDLPPISNCVPASSDFDGCADEIRELFQNVTELMALFYEYGLSSGGYSDVSCSAGDVGGAGGGSGNGGGSSDAATWGDRKSVV